MLRLRLLLFALLFLAPFQAHAQSCSFSVTDINFGNVDTLTGPAVDVTGEVEITCTNPLLPGLLAEVRTCLNINAGSGGATGGTRHLVGPGGALLNYGLYQDAARTIPWGSREQPALGSPVTVDFPQLLPGSRTQRRTIYARVLGGQSQSASGLYASAFSGAHITFNYAVYTLLPLTSCNAITSNPMRPSFTVQANVPANCQVAAHDLDFGSHGALDSNIDATGGIDVTCTPGTDYNVGLSNGLNGDGLTQRRMSLGSETVSYGLYRNSARTLPWGDIVGTGTYAGTGAGTVQHLPVYGRVPTQPTPSPGTYTDTVVVTVTY